MGSENLALEESQRLWEALEIETVFEESGSAKEGCTSVCSLSALGKQGGALCGVGGKWQAVCHNHLLVLPPRQPQRGSERERERERLDCPCGRCLTVCAGKNRKTERGRGTGKEQV